jgi:hypothetical protein
MDFANDSSDCLDKLLFGIWAREMDLGNDYPIVLTALNLGFGARQIGTLFTFSYYKK